MELCISEPLRIKEQSSAGKNPLTSVRSKPSPVGSKNVPEKEEPKSHGRNRSYMDPIHNIKGDKSRPVLTSSA